MGGYIAGNYALKYPEHVSKLIFLSPIGVSTESTKSESSRFSSLEPKSILGSNPGVFKYVA